MAEDIRVFRRLKADYPHQFKLIRYEDVALHPETFARDIFSFLQLNFTQQVKDHVTAMTEKTVRKKSGKGFMSDYTTYRDKPESEVNKWRYSAGVNQSRTVDFYCGELYSLLGYRKVESLADLMGNNSFVVEPQTHQGLF